MRQAPIPPRLLDRRAAMRRAGGLLGGAAVGSALLSGCQSLRGNGDAPPAAPRLSTSADDPDNDAADATGASSAADAALVIAIRTDLSRTRALVRAGGQRDLQVLARLHKQHAVELGGLVRSGTGGSGSAGGASSGTVAAAEARLQSRLSTASVNAASGVLAATLASMAAAVAQQRSALGLASDDEDGGNGS